MRPRLENFGIDRLARTTVVGTYVLKGSNAEERENIGSSSMRPHRVIPDRDGAKPRIASQVPRLIAEHQKSGSSTHTTFPRRVARDTLTNAGQISGSLVDIHSHGPLRLQGPVSGHRTMATSAEEQLALLEHILADPKLSADEKIARASKLRRPRSQSKSHSKSSSVSGANGAGGKLSPEEKLALITSNLQETLNVEIIEDVLKNQSRPLRIYWGEGS